MRPTLLLSMLLALVLFAAPCLADDPDVSAAAPEVIVLVDEEDVKVTCVETTCNSYFITDKASGAFVVIDPGPGLHGLIEAQTKTGGTLAWIWITHEHGDHLSGLGELAPLLKVPVVAHAIAKEEIKGVIAGWEDWGMTDVAPRPPVLPDTLVDHGDTVKVGDLAWKILHLPGHSPGSIGFLLEGRYLVIGDVLFQGSVGRTDLPTSALEVFRKSLSDHLWDLPEKTRVFPGHMQATTIGEEKKSNWLFQDYVRAARGEEPIARPWMGIQLDTERTEPGIALTVVVEGSPAESAGLKVGDVITHFDEVALTDPRAFLALIRQHGVGDEVPMKIVRDGEPKDLTFTFGARPPQ